MGLQAAGVGGTARPGAARAEGWALGLGPVARWVPGKAGIRGRERRAEESRGGGEEGQEEEEAFFPGVGGSAGDEPGWQGRASVGVVGWASRYRRRLPMALSDSGPAFLPAQVPGRVATALGPGPWVVTGPTSEGGQVARAAGLGAHGARSFDGKMEA